MTEPAGAAIPTHVPAALVYDFDYFTAPRDTISRISKSHVGCAPKRPISSSPRAMAATGS